MNLLTLAQAAAILRVSRRRVRALVDGGRIPVAATYQTRRGTERLLSRDEVERFAATPRKAGRPKA